MSAADGYYMKVSEIAEVLSVVPSTVYRMIERGVLPSVRISESSVRVPRAGFEAYMRSCESGRPVVPVRRDYTHIPVEAGELREAAEAFAERSEFDPFDFVDRWRAGTIKDTAQNSELVMEALALRKAMIAAGITPATA